MMKVTNDFYRQFEELNNKLDSLLKENRELKQEINTLKATIKEKDEIIDKQQKEIDRLKNQINKNSSNSSKPPSTNLGKKEKSGANLYNSRKKTDKKIGGQKGHKGHSLTKDKIEKIIEDKNIKTKTIYHDRKVLIKEGSKSFSNNRLGEINAKYEEIIALAKKENKDIKSSFYKEKASKLVRRCEKYKDNHMAFIYDFSIPFENNLSERDLRIIKIKTKISGSFKNIDSATSYCNAISIIKTSKKRNVNPFDSIKSIFNNEVLFAN